MLLIRILNPHLLYLTDFKFDLIWKIVLERKSFKINQ